jgi:hypothetical protein
MIFHISTYISTEIFTFAQHYVLSIIILHLACNKVYHENALAKKMIGIRGANIQFHNRILKNFRIKMKIIIFLTTPFFFSLTAIYNIAHFFTPKYATTYPIWNQIHFHWTVFINHCLKRIKSRSMTSFTPDRMRNEINLVDRLIHTSKFWGFHAGDYEECHLLGCYAMWLF